MGNYAYTISVPQGYLPLNGGSLEITEEGVLSFTLYASAPTASIKLTGTGEYGTEAQITVEASGTGEFSYVWYKDDVLLRNETGASLVFEHLEFSDTGTYRCVLSSDLCDPEDESAVITLQEELTVVQCTPKITLSFDPESGSAFSNKGISVGVTVSHPSYDDAVVPEGTVRVTVYHNNIWYSHKDADLHNGSAHIKFHPGNGTYTFYATYTPPEQGESTYFYKTVVSEDYPYAIDKKHPEVNVDYTVNEPTGNNGWYNSSGPLVITPIENMDYDRIRLVDAEESLAQLQIYDETGLGGADVRFELYDTETSSVSFPATCHYKMDSTKPNLVNIYYVQDDFCDYFYLKFIGNDNLSGIEEFRIYTSESEYTTVTYNNYLYGYYDAISFDEFKEIIWFTAVDKAGNESERLYLNKRIATITFSEPTCVTEPGGERLTDKRGQTDSLYFHLDENTPLSFTIAAEGMKSADEITVQVNGETLENVEWTQSADDQNIMVFTSDVYDEEGEYVVTLSADGYVIVCDDYLPIDGKAVCSVHSFTSATHIIDKTAPGFSASYAPPSPEENCTAYSFTRNAVITVTENYFRPENLNIVNLTITDIEGNDLTEKEEYQNIQADLLAILRSSGWQTDGNTHTSPTLPFDKEGRYSFILSGEDFGGNKGYYRSEAFVIDKTAPSDLSITYSPNAVTAFLDVITFGFYKDSGFFMDYVQVDIRAEDRTSGVDHFTVTYTQEEGSGSLGDHDEEIVLSEDDLTISYTENGRVAEASFTLTASEYRQYRGRLSITATDRAGNTCAPNNGSGLAHDSEGEEFTMPDGAVIIVDNIAPECEVTIPEPKLIRDEKKAVFDGEKKDYDKLDDPNKNEYTFYYTDKDVYSVKIGIKITEANFDPFDEDLKVLVNGENTTVEWTQLEPNVWTGEIVLTTDNTYRIEITYTDHSGNVMESYRSCFLVLDRVDPEVTQFYFNPSTVDGDSQTGQFIQKLEYGYYFKTDFAVTVSTSDAEISSGLYYLACRLISYKDGKRIGEETQSPMIKDGKANLKIPSGFKGQIFVQCFDYAGNKSAEVTPQGLVVDRIGPDIKIVTNQNTGFHDAAGNRLFIDDTSLTVTISDRDSGLKRLQYRQQSEKGVGDWVVTEIANTGVQLGSTLANGWVVSAMDENLVTEVTRTFVYSEDDNDIFLTVSAADRSENTTGDVKSETFTVDKTAPVITAAFDNGPHEDIYYSKARSVVITVRERNFDAARIITEITNAIGAVPNVHFDKLSDSEYRAVLDFPQGDYTFDINGTDLGGHKATVTLSGGNERLFVVDTTKPGIATNFETFVDPAHENHFAESKTAVITITEHNFSPELVKLRVYQREAGTSKGSAEFKDVTASVLKNAQWTTEANKDVHTIQFVLEADAVYQIELEPSDLAGNQAERIASQIFEIDQTIPVILARNGREVSADDVNLLDIYDHGRENDPIPDLTFFDTNLSCLEYQLFVWIPDYSNKDQYPEMRGKQVFLLEDPEQAGVIYGDKITLSNFTEDGIYTLNVIAVDMAGNRSVENVNTFVRIAKSPILAYIEDSNLSKRTGLFSFEDAELNPISMRSDGFMDLVVVVFSQAGSDVEVVLRDGNGDETAVGDYAGKPSEQYEEIYGIDVGRYLIPRERFAELYPEDTDAKLYLSVKNDTEKLDLGVIHIDNIVPNCTVPEGLHSWKWYVGNGDRTFTITDINEALDIENSAVYDNGNEIKDIVYSPENATITFTLSKGWHNIGIKLTDLAGNTKNIQEITHVQIGLFWLWIILAGLALIGAGTVFGIRSRRKKLEQEE